MTTTLLALVALLATLAAPASAVASLESRQWGLEQIGAPSAWAVTRGEGATVAVVDSGLDLGHPEFAGRIVGGATFTGCADDPDGCGNGDLRSGNDPEPSVHGTHVAGIVAAADDGQGVTGVAPRARLLAVKVIQGDGEGNQTGTSDEVSAGIRWATRNGADVINLSLSQSPAAPALYITGLAEPIDDAIEEALAAGVVVVAAAGNDRGIPVCDEPAFSAGVVCVIATDRFENRAVYSNQGVSEDLLVVSAPGGAAVLTCSEDVLSTFPVGTEDPSCPTIPAGYGYLAGTSMAAPHVAGVAALQRAAGQGQEQVVDRLVTTARNPVTGLRGTYDPMYGYGIVDAPLAVGSADLTVVTRHAGGDRVGTAVAVSRRVHPDGAPAVTIARADDYADALAGAPLAAHTGGPLLLTARDELSGETGDEIDRLGAGTAYLLGGEQALSPAVEAALRDRGLDVVRLAGASRYATAVAIADALPERSRVYVVEGFDPDPARGWPDALSASGLAAAVTEPVLLTPTESLPADTAAAIDGSTDVVIVGGEASVSRQVEEQLRARARSVRRLAGATRYETSAAVAEEAQRRGVESAQVWVATGRAFPDGLAAGAAAGTVDGLFLLVDGTDLDDSPATRDVLARNGRTIDAVRLAGGRNAISDQVERQILDVVN